MLTRRSPAVERRPGRHMHHIGGGSNPLPQALLAEFGERGHEAVRHIALDQLGIATVEADQQDPGLFRGAGVCVRGGR